MSPYLPFPLTPLHRPINASLLILPVGRTTPAFPFVSAVLLHLPLSSRPSIALHLPLSVKLLLPVTRFSPSTTVAMKMLLSPWSQQTCF